MRATEHIIDELNQRDLLELAKKIASTYRITVEEMLSDSHRRENAGARHEFWRVLHEEHSFSYERLARLMGMNHSTISTGVMRARVRASGASKAVAS